MIRRTFAVSAVLLAIALGTAAGVTVTWDQWPYGVRYIGSYSKWWMSPTGGSVTVPAFNPDDSIWDMVNIGGSSVNRNAESWIMTKGSAQGSPPAYCTFAEKQVQGGQTSWGYEHMDTTGSNQTMWLYGFYTQGTQIDYESPYQEVYQFPMAVGNEWLTTWEWNYLGVDQVYESRHNYVVAQGRVRVQADTMHYYPCVVIRTYSTTSDELGQLNDSRIVHEWVVPDMGLVGGSVCTIQSQSGEANPDFTNAEHVFRMKEFHSTFDNTAPAFMNTTVIPSGYNLGPFLVSSAITDQNGVVKDSIYFKVGGGAWLAAGRDSTHAGTYFFHIPQLGGADSVRYYLAASDTAAGHNRGTDPVGAPGVCYSFYARNPADDHFAPVITGTTQYNDTVFVGPFPVTATVVDSCSVDSVLIGYRFNTGAEVLIVADSVRGSTYYMTIPAAAMNTFVRYRVRAVDGSPNHNAGFDPGSGFYGFNVIDGAGPSFSGTTELFDTTFAGPFYITSELTDPSGIFATSIFFKYGSLAWDSLPGDSSSGDTFSFHLPQVTAPMSIRYYLKGWDNSQNHNAATDPTDAPNSYYVFFCDPSGAIAEPGRAFLATLGMASINPSEVLASLPVAGKLRVTVYDVKGGVVATLASGNYGAGSVRFAVPSGLANGTYVIRAALGNTEMRRGFVVSR